MKKKLVSFGMAAMMAASLAACGGSKPAETTAAAGDAETTAAAEGAETEAAAEGAEGGTLKIGVIGPLTGAGAAYGNAVANGAELAAKEINEAGGINGMMIETKAEDDENDPEKDAQLFFTLASCNPDQHLQNLMKLSKMLMNEDVVKALVKAKSPEDLLQIQEQYLD